MRKGRQSFLAGGWRLAFRALECSTALPRNQATFDKVKATYITQPLTDTSAGVLRSLCEEILRKSSDKTARQLTVGMVDKRMKSLKGAAQPGSTRAKNTHLLLMMKAPWGAEVIRMWAAKWIAGSVPETDIEYWTHGLVAPLSKKSGNGVRPITLFETAYKLATGLVLDLHKSKIIKAVGAYQYGALLASGADRFVYGVN